MLWRIRTQNLTKKTDIKKKYGKRKKICVPCEKKKQPLPIDFGIIVSSKKFPRFPNFEAYL